MRRSNNRGNVRLWPMLPKQLILQAQGFPVFQCFTILFAGHPSPCLPLSNWRLWPRVRIAMRWRIDFRDHRAHLFLMQQSGKRLTILVTNEEVIAIDDFRFKNRMRNRSDAVRALLKLGLKKVGRRPRAKPP